MCMTNYNLSNKTLFFDKLIFFSVLVNTDFNTWIAGSHILRNDTF